MNRPLTYRVVQDNATGYGKKPILRSPECNAGHQQGGHSTVPGTRSTECQSCTDEWISDAPFGTEQAGQCQAPILVVAPFTGALLHEVENCSSFIYPPPMWPGELSPSANPKITRILFISGTIVPGLFLIKPYEAGTRINSHPRHHIMYSPSLTAEAPGLSLTSCI